MASQAEIIAQLQAAADGLQTASGQLRGAQDEIEAASALVTTTFEGTGDAQAMEVNGRLQQMSVNLSDMIVECGSLQTNLEDIAGRQ